MPGIVGQHDRELLLEIHCQDPLTRLLERHPIDRTAPLVELLELACDDVGLVLIFGEQKLDATNGVAEATGGVQSRRENEADPAGSELLPFQTGRAKECAHANVARLREHLEAVADEDAILS